MKTFSELEEDQVKNYRNKYIRFTNLLHQLVSILPNFLVHSQKTKNVFWVKSVNLSIVTSHSLMKIPEVDSPTCIKMWVQKPTPNPSGSTL